MDFDARIDSLAPVAVRCLPMDDRHGRAVVVAIAKLTYVVSPTGHVRRADPPTPVRCEDEPFDADPSPHGSVRSPSDWIDDKPGTDVIVAGTALPPEGVVSTEMDVSVRVGRLFKAVKVFGPRVYQPSLLGGVSPGPPSRLGPTPLRYELAFGGVDDTDPDRIAFDPKNPAGVGFAAVRQKRAGGPAPRLVAISTLGEPGREPAGFGPIGAHWSPRVELAGTRDDAWRKKRAPVAPLDFDPRHNALAHPDLYSATPLRADEPVEILGMTREQAWRFRLPAAEVRFESRLDGEVRPHDTHLDTFLIDADHRRVELVWRVSIPLPRKAQRLDRITVKMSGEVPPSVLEAPFEDGRPDEKPVEASP